MFWRESTWLLPGRSGSSSVFSFNTFTNPGGSPQGEASACPSALAELRIQNGDKAMKFPECTSKWSNTFCAARAAGGL